MKAHQKSITELAHLLSTDIEDCVAWVEEFIIEETGGAGLEFEFDNLEDNLTEEQIESVSQSLIEHFEKEDSIKLEDVIKLVSNLKTK